MSSAGAGAVPSAQEKSAEPFDSCSAGGAGLQHCLASVL